MCEQRKDRPIAGRPPIKLDDDPRAVRVVSMEDVVERLPPGGEIMLARTPGDRSKIMVRVIAHQLAADRILDAVAVAQSVHPQKLAAIADRILAGIERYHAMRKDHEQGGNGGGATADGTTGQ